MEAPQKIFAYFEVIVLKGGWVPVSKHILPLKKYENCIFLTHDYMELRAQKEIVLPMSLDFMLNLCL